MADNREKPWWLRLDGLPPVKAPPTRRLASAGGSMLRFVDLLASDGDWRRHGSRMGRSLLLRLRSERADFRPPRRRDCCSLVCYRQPCCARGQITLATDE